MSTLHSLSGRRYPVFEIGVYFTCIAHLGLDQPHFMQLSSHRQLVATVLDEVVTKICHIMRVLMMGEHEVKKPGG